MRPTPGHAYVPPAGPRREVTLRDQRHVLIRPIERQDAQAEREFIQALSPEARRSRFLCQMGTPSEALIESLTDVDYSRDVALVAVVPEGARDRIVGACRYVLRADPAEAEVAVVVLDAWQEQGLGTALMRQVLDIARDRGIHRLVSFDSSENVEMRDLARHLGFHLRSDPQDPGMVIHTLSL